MWPHHNDHMRCSSSFCPLANVIKEVSDAAEVVVVVEEEEANAVAFVGSFLI